MKKLLPLLFLSCFIVLANAQITYVKSGGTGNGSSWANASGDLANAMNTANANTEIWVAQGIYYPDNSTNREEYFHLKNGVELYGGFAGNESQRSQRNWQNNITTLSGDINHNGTLSGNSYTIVYTNNVNASTIADGFHIEAGNAMGTNGSNLSPFRSGGGWYNTIGGAGNTSNPTIRNCTFSGNKASQSGGGFYNDGGNGTANPTFENCIFDNNTANEGAGIYNFGQAGITNPTITNCTFKNNNALYGGGIYNNANGGTCSPKLVNCILDNNSSSFYGGGIYSFVKSNIGFCLPELVNCIISNNDGSSAGGIYSLAAANGTFSASLVNCAFYGNYANVGGAYYANGSNNASSTSTFANCIFWESTAGYDPVFHFSGTGNPIVNLSYCLMDAANCNGLSGPTNGIINCGVGMKYSQDPLFVDAAANDFHLTATSPAKDMGDNAAINATGLTVDLDNQSRIVSTTVDMGPYEFTTGDSDGDGITDNIDNCPNTPNSNQANADGDPAGDVCDCDPNDSSVYPGASEICDGLDNNCNNQIDESGDITYYADNDGDTYGDPGNTINACSPPSGYVENDLDCDDSDDSIFPGALEICDGLDNNCDGQIDENVQDDIPPTVVCRDIAVSLDNNGTASILPADVYASGSDNCGAINLLMVVPDNFTTTDLGANTVTLTVDDGNGNSATCQAIVTVTPHQPGPLNYCTSLGDQPWVEWIENVTFGTIDNPSSKERYADFTNLTTVVDQGGSYPISLKPQFSWPHFSEYFRVWIDYNQDGDFTDANEIAFSGITPVGQSGSNPPAVTGTIDIPANATAGTTRMRISMQRDAYPESCESFDFGEVEDYTVVINIGGPVLSLACPDDLMITAAPGENSAIATWPEPSNGSTCTSGSVTLTQTGGPVSGSIFPLGITTISYEATDDCGNIENCSFDIIVQEFSTTLSITCPDNINETLESGNTEIAISWPDPATNSDCPTGMVLLTQTNGLPSGSLFGLGNHTITYSASDDCGNQSTCSFTISVNDPNPGQIPDYCSSMGQQPWQAWIANVSFEAIDNSSLKSRYSDFTDQSTLVNAGASYTISLSPSFSWTQWEEYFSVWIDFNQDGDFDDVGELAFSGISPIGNPPADPPPLTGTITIPNDATTGITGMRVSMNQDAYATPCEVFSLGEVEDYAVVIAGPINRPLEEKEDAALRNAKISVDRNSESAFEIFPNPATDYVDIDLQDFVGQEIELLIFDQLGQLKLLRRIERVGFSAERLDLSTLRNGVYVLVLRSGGLVRGNRMLVVVF